MIMCKDHPKWEEFILRLSGPEGCDFKEDANGKTTWKCKNGEDKSLAIKILRAMDIEDIEGTISYFEDNSGYCDCEILFNVEDCNE